MSVSQVRPDQEPRITPPSRWAAPAWAMLGLAGVFVVLLAGHYLSLVIPEVVLGLQLSAVAILGTWLALCIFKPWARVRTPLLFPVVIACTAYVLSALFSQRPRLSVESTVGGLAFACAFVFLVRLLAQPWFRVRAAMLFVTAAISIAVLYIVQVILFWFQWWAIVGSVVGPPLRPYWAGLNFGSPNVLASFLLLSGPLTVAIVAQQVRRRSVVVVIAAIFAVGVLLTGSRGALIGVVAGLLASTVLAAATGGSTTMRQVLSAPRRTLSVVAVVGIGIGTLLLPSLLYRLGTGGDTVRLDLWRSAIAIFADHPLVGGGPGTWVQLKMFANPDGVPNNVFNNAHNMYVQAAAELGLAGLVAMAVLGWLVARRMRAIARRSGQLRWETIAVAGSLAAVGGQILVENMIRLPSVCLVIAFLVAWVDSGPSPSEAATELNPRKPRALPARLLPAIGFAGILVCIPTILRFDFAMNNSAAGNEAARNGNWPLALAKYDAAIEGDPTFTLYEIERAGALARVGRTQDARDQLATALSADPTAINQIGLAALEAELGHFEAASGLARRALAMGIGEPAVALNAGLVGEQIGDLSLTRDGFSLAIAWAPSLAADAFWDAPQRKVGRAEVMARARSLVDSLDAALISAYGGNPDDARAELSAMAPSATRTIYLAVADWRGGNPAKAIDALSDVVQSDPLDWTAAAWAARIARLSGDLPRAARYTEWAVAVQGDTAPSVIWEDSIIRSTDPGAEFAGLPKGYPSAVYLRPVTPFLPMPQLVLVGVH